MAPTFAPLLKRAVARARSRRGNHSVTVLMEAGKLPASPMPKALRTAMCITVRCPTNALRIPKIDQTMREQARPNFVRSDQ